MEKAKMQKAWFFDEYGPKEVLKLGDFPIPNLQHEDVLVRVLAAALNPIDYKRRESTSFPCDFPVIPGCDLAGVVVDIGPNATKFKPGDEVYGNVQEFDEETGKLKQYGCLSQYVVVEEKLLASKPSNLSYEEAASLPVACQTAMEGFKNGGFRAGQSVFVVGGAGGVGSAVVQLAKHCLGASRVVASCSTKKLEFVKSLGADAVVDYTTTEYEDIDEKFDFVFDSVGESIKSAVVATDDAPVIDITWPPTNTRATFSSLTVNGEILEKLRPYIESGKLKAVMDPTGPYRFEDIIKAFGYIETGRAWGKVVISSFPCETSEHIVQNGEVYPFTDSVAD